ncbi:MAG: sulfite oxidase heme-binding subunit YedZ [Gemmatimonadota bacterium]
MERARSTQTGRPGRILPALRVLLWAGALAPAVWLMAGMPLGWLGVNPIERATHVTGLTTLILLLLTLSITPLRRVTGWNPLVKLRRPLGLFAFFYATVHFSIWLFLDLGLEFSWIAEDIAKRPYITVGFTAFLLLIPLAVTSTRGWIRRLGRRWATLHRLIYVAAGLGVIHFYWLVKADVRLPLFLGSIYLFLMAWRLPRAGRPRRKPLPKTRPEPSP